MKTKTYCIPIIRLRCSRCDRTFSLLPNFISAQLAYANHIREGIARWFLAGYTMTQIIQRLCTICELPIVSLRSLYRWKRRWRPKFEDWCIRMQSALALELESNRSLLDLYRNGLHAAQERNLFMAYFLDTKDQRHLPRMGKVLDAYNLLTPPNDRW